MAAHRREARLVQSRGALPEQTTSPSLGEAIAEAARAAGAVVERRIELLGIDLERGLTARLKSVPLLLFATSFAGALAAGAWMAATAGLAFLLRERFGLPAALGSVVLVHVALGLVALRALRAARSRA